MSTVVHVLGLDPGYWQNFWSGLGSDIGELSLIPAGIFGVRRLNCHVKRCHRVGRFPVEGTPWTVCGRHHPADIPSAADLER